MRSLKRSGNKALPQLEKMDQPVPFGIHPQLCTFSPARFETDHQHRKTPKTLPQNRQVAPKSGPAMVTSTAVPPLR